ncbi:dicarboxylate/amino acid:cation symporter [Carnobacterium inhibens]|jgi:Na+/H+-dicarboxylate symporter|uniref:Sodium:dicarboxylate symporter n=2 Tax=Carnobacterium inhibens TaxID=147709 RepID=U5SB51_9LACT|nr:dicarboxylate/amino acid:cation symporter [Carnobacterium inhibens]AGY82271.1 sodium:dicarboxylate symporter [Carnobacterium inhibens subsp. gilichinskyi]MBC9824414.1 cation:dicarboxylase symporter family transporter [Carnobacterium inhibens]MCM3511787.1 dicarboxylate/amino acid:cation symporter [Carnobacterium inhibens]
MKRIKLGLVTKLLIAIILGIIFGQLDFLPDFIIQIPVTISSLFSSVLSFIIPLMIIGFVVVGIADLTQGAGKLLGLTTVLAYASTLIAGMIAYFVAVNLFPLFIDASLSKAVVGDQPSLEPLFSIPIEPMLDVTSAIVFSFMFGICISWLKGQGKGETMYNFFSEFSLIISKLLNSFIIPGLPFFIFGNFVNLSYTGSVFSILSIFWKVFAIVIGLQLILVSLFFVIAGLYAKKNPFTMIKNQIPGYVTAIGTQSSAATIPVNLEVAKKNGVSAQIREFVIPLCATIHLLGSIVTVTSCVTAVLLIYNMPVHFGMMAGFIAMLGVAMIAAPGAPGGGIMSALPFMTMVGIDPTGVLGNLLITLYLTQDSFGTAANISGDNAIAVIVDKVYYKHILKKSN